MLPSHGPLCFLKLASQLSLYLSPLFLSALSSIFSSSKFVLSSLPLLQTTMTQTGNSNNCRNNGTRVIKFLYSYGGKIIPRRPDGVLRYVGGHTRVLSVDPSITFAELMIKFGELSGESMSLRCKLPNEDLDVLVSVKSDEDLRNVIAEYERFSPSDTKIRAILVPINSPKKISPPSSPMSCFDFPTAAPPPKLKPASRYMAAKPAYFSPAVGYPAGGVRNGVRHSHDHSRRVYFNNPQWHFCQ